MREMTIRRLRRAGALAARLKKVAPTLPVAATLVAPAAPALPVAAAPAPPTVSFPASAITTGGTSLTVTGTGPAGASVVVFRDLDGNGRFHSIEPNWYQRVRRDGTFSVPIHLVENTDDMDLFALVETADARSEPRGSFTLNPDGTYQWLDNGGSGQYQYDAASGQIAWLSGPLADKLPEKTTYRRNQQTTQIDVRFLDSFEWSCGHNL